MNIQLSRNFSLKEFATSREFPELAGEIIFRPVEVERLSWICMLYLQPLRDEYGPVVITSGKRTPELNRAVGGVEHSSHLFLDSTAAVDFTVPDADLWKVFDFFRHCLPPAKKIIIYPDLNFIHVSFPYHGSQRRLEYVYKHGTYIRYVDNREVYG